VSFDYNGFFLRNRSTGNLSSLNWGGAGGGVWGDGNGLPTNSIRYDSPTFGGFSVSASWGESDFWDIAARYAGEWHDFKVSVAGAYSQSSADNINSVNMVQPAGTGYFQIGAYVEHVPTGLFAYGAYGHLDYFDDSLALRPNGLGSNDTYYLKGGIRQRWNPLGHTVLYGEYMHAENHNSSAIDNGDGLGTDFDGTSAANLWGVGAVQEIDAAAMSLWVKYRNISANTFGAGSFDADEMHQVSVGALINF
jgi:predicted porin